MASNLTAMRPAAVCEGRRSAEAIPSPALARLATALRAAFGSEFSLLDGGSGDLLQTAADHAGLDWLPRAEICRAVARRGAAELIEDDDLLLSLAIPLTSGDDQTLVAVGTFLGRAVQPHESLERLQHLLGMNSPALGSWLLRQSTWSPDALLRLARLFVAKLSSDRRAENLEKEVGSLSLHLATTYEEISLLYRLTQNLKLSSKDEELGGLALEWLAEVLPVESLAIQLVPLAVAGTVGHEARSEPLLLSHGPCPIDSSTFSAFVGQFALGAAHHPHVLNESTTGAPGWKFPAIRQMIIVPLSEGNNIFGWLAVFNHSQGREFGTVEASLLTSVAAILGIHSGNTELYRQQAEFFASVVRALTSAVDAKDPYTCGHSNRVARVSARLAQELALDSEQVNTIYLSGLLHDIGKIGIDDTVLRKPGPLTAAEYEHIKTHAEIGHRILDGLKELDEVLPVVLHHHEQWDGKGYPHKLAGEAIPLLARIVAVADSVDAMGSDRPYRTGMPEEKMDSILQQGAGKQWDARVVEAFFRARDDIREISRRERKNLGLDVNQWA